MPTKYTFYCLAFVLLTTGPLAAQGEGSPDFMRSLGKMYVVVGVIVLVFLGIVALLWWLDRRLTKLEAQISDHVQR